MGFEWGSSTFSKKTKRSTKYFTIKKGLLVWKAWVCLASGHSTILSSLIDLENLEIYMVFKHLYKILKIGLWIKLTEQFGVRVLGESHCIICVFSHIIIWLTWLPDRCYLYARGKTINIWPLMLNITRLCVELIILYHH